jgi:hypothetical protein
MTQVDFLLDLPLEVCCSYRNHLRIWTQIGQHILNYVDGPTLLLAGCVSRRWGAVAGEERVWRVVLLRNQLQTIGLVFVFSSNRIRADLPSTPAWLTTVRPSKAVYMRHCRTAVNWRSRALCQQQIVLGDKNSGRHGMAALTMNDEHLAYFEDARSTFHVYTAATMQCIYTHTRDLNINLRFIVFCPDANAVITGHHDGLVHVHTLPQSTSQQPSISVQIVGVPFMLFKIA